MKRAPRSGRSAQPIQPSDPNWAQIAQSDLPVPTGARAPLPAGAPGRSNPRPHYDAVLTQLYIMVEEDGAVHQLAWKKCDKRADGKEVPGWKRNDPPTPLSPRTTALCPRWNQIPRTVRQDLRECDRCRRSRDGPPRKAEKKG
ncbi:hypothetical protein KM043_013968 [Ampulex compressa]|nr:hypothetical protein KM043_013968 [Ampulex compressa]